MNAGALFSQVVTTALLQKPSQSLQTILYEYLAPYHIPVLFDLPIGHISPNIGIPLGATATINTNNKTVSISSGIATSYSN